MTPSQWHLLPDTRENKSSTKPSSPPNPCLPAWAPADPAQSAARLWPLKHSPQEEPSLQGSCCSSSVLHSRASAGGEAPEGGGGLRAAFCLSHPGVWCCSTPGLGASRERESRANSFCGRCWGSACTQALEPLYLHLCTLGMGAEPCLNRPEASPALAVSGVSTAITACSRGAPTPNHSTHSFS